MRSWRLSPHAPACTVNQWCPHAPLNADPTDLSNQLFYLTDHSEFAIFNRIYHAAPALHRFGPRGFARRSACGLRRPPI